MHDETDSFTSGSALFDSVRLSGWSLNFNRFLCVLLTATQYIASEINALWPNSCWDNLRALQHPFFSFPRSLSSQAATRHKQWGAQQWWQLGRWDRKRWIRPWTACRQFSWAHTQIAQMSLTLKFTHTNSELARLTVWYKDVTRSLPCIFSDLNKSSMLLQYFKYFRFQQGEQFCFCLFSCGCVSNTAFTSNHGKPLLTISWQKKYLGFLCLVWSHPNWVVGFPKQHHSHYPRTGKGETGEGWDFPVLLPVTIRTQLSKNECLATDRIHKIQKFNNKRKAVLNEVQLPRDSLFWSMLAGGQSSTYKKGHEITATDQLQTRHCKVRCWRSDRTFGERKVHAVQVFRLTRYLRAGCMKKTART